MKKMKKNRGECEECISRRTWGDSVIRVCQVKGCSRLALRELAAEFHRPKVILNNLKLCERHYYLLGLTNGL